MTNDLKPIPCGCGGEAKVQRVRTLKSYVLVVMCTKCEIATNYYTNEAEAIQAWNRAMGKRTVKVELNPLAEDIVIGNTTFKIGTHVIAECECGTWLRLGYKYCPNCGARLEWDE